MKKEHLITADEGVLLLLLLLMLLFDQNTWSK